VEAPNNDAKLSQPDPSDVDFRVAPVSRQAEREGAGLVRGLSRAQKFFLVVLLVVCPASLITVVVQTFEIKRLEKETKTLESQAAKTKESLENLTTQKENFCKSVEEIKREKRKLSATLQEEINRLGEICKQP
jgi:biopolymer transport protein ExbB/TolQ